MHSKAINGKAVKTIKGEAIKGEAIKGEAIKGEAIEAIKGEAINGEAIKAIKGDFYECFKAFLDPFGRPESIKIMIFRHPCLDAFPFLFCAFLWIFKTLM